jgi:hypothetical protein
MREQEATGQITAPAGPHLLLSMRVPYSFRSTAQTQDRETKDAMFAFLCITFAVYSEHSLVYSCKELTEHLSH